MRIDLYLDINKCFIDNKDVDEYTDNISIDEIIRIVDENSGNLWGTKHGDYYLGDGAVFKLYLDGDHLAVGKGERFIQLRTTDESSKMLWASLYKLAGKKKYLGKISREQKLKILNVLFWKAVLIKKNSA